MKKHLFSLVVFSFVCVGINAQDNDPVLMTVGKRNIRKSEFEAVYHKNNNNAKADEKALNEYLELYTNFRLKVAEAEELGLDTTEAFKSELKGYRQQLAQPYLTDNEVTENLIKEAYERSKYDIKASHILVKVDENALPKDTLAAYNKALKVRERLLKGENFEKVAKEVSDDPSAKDNGGNLGYFTALQMVYPFENAAYNTKVGEVSMPIRTRFGYHILKVFDKRDARGQILTAHIMASTRGMQTAADTLAAKQKLEEIQAKIKQGVDFAELAKQFSDDPGSASKGGQLPWFGTGKMVPEFEEAAFQLKNNGDVSDIIQTKFGFHIIKRLDYKPLPSFDEMKAELKQKIAKDTRSQKSRESFIERIKKEYGFKENLKNRDEFIKVIDSTFFKGEWKAEKAAKLNKELFSIGNKKYTQTDFAKFIESQQSTQPATDYKLLIEKLYKNFTDKAVIDYEDEQLENKYPDFRNLMNEYRDGILLFELTDKKVWSKAVKDTAGLEAFYNANKDKFMWGERLEADIFYCKDEATAAKTRKLVEKGLKKGYNVDEIQKQINTDSQLNLKVVSGKFSKGDNKIIDSIDWNVGLTKNQNVDNQIVFVNVKRKIAPEPKTLKEARGVVTAEYQNQLEKEWLKELKAKYPVNINREVLKTVK
jgi:peptidyl-prolyl cis-trans isomerase SurA